MRTTVLLVVALALLSACTPADAIREVRRQDLEERVKRTAFGREMLSVVNAQLQNASSASSFRGVQDFLDQIFKRVVNEQISEAMLHAEHVKHCKATLKKLLETTHAKSTLVTDLNRFIARDKAKLVSIPAAIKAKDENIQKLNKAIKHLKSLLSLAMHYRKNSHETYKRKFTESKQIVEAVQKIVNQMNLFYPSKNQKSFIEDMGVTSDNHLASLLMTAEQLYNQEMLKPTANTEDVRNLLVLLDEEIRKYMARLNTNEKINLADNTAKQNRIMAQITPKQAQVANDTAYIKSAKADLKLAKETLEANTHEQTLQSRLLAAVKTQLKTQSSFCKAQTESDKKEATFRSEQRKTLRALQQIVVNHIAKHNRALAAQAQREEVARQQAIAVAQKRLEANQKRMKAGKLPVNHHLEIPVKATPVHANITQHVTTHTHLPTKAKSTCQSILTANASAASGVYTLETAGNVKFKAYCDMKTNGGGWMLAYKQYDYASGSVKYNSKLLGSAKFLTGFAKTHKATDSTRDGSLLGYGNPKEFLFQSSVPSNWFTTGALSAWQDYQISNTDRFCLLRTHNTTYTKFTLSPTWDTKKTAMWSNADIQMMSDEEPTISAITIGQAVQAQKAPQCYAPNCSPARHGRYNGYCQDGSAGEGNWLVFIR